MAWAATEEIGLSGRAGEWTEAVMSRGDLSAVDGARELGIGPEAEQASRQAPLRHSILGNHLTDCIGGLRASP